MMTEIPVATLRDRVNEAIAESDDPDIKCRVRLASLLEKILIETENYRGFEYLPSEYNADGELKDPFDATRVRFN